MWEGRCWEWKYNGGEKRKAKEKISECVRNDLRDKLLSGNYV